jgi:membrane protein implicated in regulation of membrane protease activity
MEFMIYFVFFGVGLIFTLASAFFGHLFSGHDGVGVGGAGGHADVGTGGHADSGYDSGGMPGISILSPTTIASFVTALGGLGMIFSRIEATRSAWISAPLSILGGLVVAGMVLWLFNAVFSRTQSSSESRVASLLGQSATIITPIPVRGVGEIAYVQSGTRYSAPARDESGEAIANGQTVKIVRIVGSQFYVSPV